VNLFVVLVLSTLMMAGCSSFSLEELYEDEYENKKVVTTKNNQRSKKIKFSAEEKVALERISNEYGKCAAYYKYAILIATTTDEPPFENIDEVGQKRGFFIKYALGVAVQFAGEKKGRVLAIENYMDEYRINILMREPAKIALLKRKRKEECSPALSNPEAFARSYLQSAESDMQIRLSDVLKRIETVRN
jgi:ABC-type amino acid transport substrate-binding protein